MKLRLGFGSGNSLTQQFCSRF